MRNTSDFYPCPFCGETSIMIEQMLKSKMWCIWCPSCNMGKMDFELKKEAIEAWNKRTKNKT